MLVVSPSCTMEEVVLKYCPMAGRVGRYMSVTNGPNAVSMPNRMSRKILEFSFIDDFFELRGKSTKHLAGVRCFLRL